MYLEKNHTNDQGVSANYWVIKSISVETKTDFTYIVSGIVECFLHNQAFTENKRSLEAGRFIFEYANLSDIDIDAIAQKIKDCEGLVLVSKAGGDVLSFSDAIIHE